MAKNMRTVLSKVPLVPWVRKTIEKMNAIGKDDSKTWSRFWLQVYSELGGTSENSGLKGCSKSAAYALWRLGRIAGSKRLFENWTIEQVQEEFGKNAVYAILTLDLLETGWEPRDLKSLWAEVKRLYGEKLSQAPALSEQGAVKVATILFSEGQIVSNQR